MTENSFTFIPKRTSVPERYGEYRGPFFNFFNFLAFIILLASLAMLAGVHLYKQQIDRNIIKLQDKIVEQKSEFEPALIEELILIGREIDSVKELFKNHRTATPIFEFLEENTLEETSFNQFNLSQDKLSLQGETKNFRKLAEQILLFKSNPLVRDLDFERLVLGPSGRVGFNFGISLNPEILFYKP